jgi:hypothetical protein
MTIEGLDHIIRFDPKLVFVHVTSKDRDLHQIVII